ncbi:MAG: hypothetical protein ACREMY_04695 [bacterium]
MRLPSCRVVGERVMPPCFICAICHAMFSTEAEGLTHLKAEHDDNWRVIFRGGGE